MIHINKLIVNNIVIKKLDVPLCFTAVDAGATIAFNKVGSPNEAGIVTSTDGKTWTPYTFNTVVTLANAGDKVYFRAKDQNDISFYANSSNYYRFASDAGKRIAASGNLNALISLFDNNNNITMASYQYKALFAYNVALVTPPKLPNSVLSPGCYEMLFGGCSALTEAPILPGTTLATHCYQNMFYNCKSLTSAPDLPATTIAPSCYSYMFNGCSSLTGNTTVTLAQTSAIPNNALYRTFINTIGQAQLTFILDFSNFTEIPQLPDADTISMFNSTTDTRLTIKVPASLLTTWKESSNWSNFADRIVAA